MQIEVYTGKKWKAAKELKIAEERLREKNVLGVVELLAERAWGYAKVKRKTEWEKW